MVAQVQQDRKPIIYPKVPKEVKHPVAPLFQEWADLAGEYESRPTSLQAAWLYLGHHPAFWTLQEAHDGSLRVVTGTAWYQAIETGFTQDDHVWMELGPNYWDDDPTEEDILAVAPGSPPRNIEVVKRSYEEALVATAAAVHERYGNDREFLNYPLQGRWLG